MTITPRYDESVVKTISVFTGPRAQGQSVDAFGAGIGQGLQSLGNAGLDIASTMQKQDEQTKAYDYRVKLDDHENTLKFGDPGDEGDEGFLKIEGSEAMQYKDTYLQDFKERAFNDIPQDVHPVVKAQLERMAQERYNQLSNEFNRHAMAQESQANDAATGAMQASILRNISDNPYDDNRFQLELGTLKHVVDLSVTKRYGEDNEQATQIRKSALELAVNDAYSKRLNRILLDDPAKAKQFLDDNTGIGTFTPETVDHYTQILKPLVANQDGINLAYDFIPRLKAGEPVDVLIAEAHEKTKARPEVFKIAEAQIRSAEADIHNANVQTAQRLATPIQKLIIDREKGGGKMSPAELLNSDEYKQLVAVGTPEALTLAAGYSDKTFSEHHAIVTEQRAVQNEQRRDRNEQRREIKSDRRDALLAQKSAQQEEFTNLSLKPDEVASMSDFEVVQKSLALGPHYGEQFRKLKASLSSPEKLAQVKLETKTFNSILAQLGIRDKKKVSAYYASTQNYLVAQQQDGKRVFNPQQIRDAVVAAFQDVEVNQRMYPLGSDSLSYTWKATKKRIDVQDPAAIVIPKAYDDVITKKFKEYGITDTPENRHKAYDRMLGDRGSKLIKPNYEEPARGVAGAFIDIGEWVVNELGGSDLD